MISRVSPLTHKRQGGPYQTTDPRPALLIQGSDTSSCAIPLNWERGLRVEPRLCRGLGGRPGQTPRSSPSAARVILVSRRRPGGEVRRPSHTYLQTLQPSVGSEEQQKPQGEHEDVLQVPFHGAGRKLHAREALQFPERHQPGSGRASVPRSHILSWSPNETCVSHRGC